MRSENFQSFLRRKFRQTNLKLIMETINARIVSAYQKKDHNECLKLLKDSLKSNPSFVPHRILQAECWTALKINHEKVLEAFGEVIAENPNCAIAFYGLGHAHYCQGDMWEAVDSLDKAIHLNTSNNMQKAVELKQKAKNIMEAICDGKFLKIQNYVDCYLCFLTLIANVKFEMNNIEKALKILSIASSIDPSHEKLQKKIAGIREFFIKDLVERLDNEVSREVTKSCKAFEIKAKLENAEKLIQEDKITEAEAVMKEISELDSTSDRLVFLKAYAQYMSGSLKPAIELFKETLKLNSTHQRALELLEKAVKSNLHFETAAILIEENKHNDAIETFTKILTVDEKNFKVIQAAYFQRSLAYFNIGSPTEALKDFKLFQATQNGLDITSV